MTSWYTIPWYLHHFQLFYSIYSHQSIFLEDLKEDLSIHSDSFRVKRIKYSVVNQNQTKETQSTSYLVVGSQRVNQWWSKLVCVVLRPLVIRMWDNFLTTILNLAITLFAVAIKHFCNLFYTTVCIDLKPNWKLCFIMQIPHNKITLKCYNFFITTN